jgi:hypothetical protein
VPDHAKVTWVARVAVARWPFFLTKRSPRGTPARAHWRAALCEADQVLHGRYDKIDLPLVRSVVTRVERYARHCRCCGGVTLAPVVLPGFASASVA